MRVSVDVRPLADRAEFEAMASFDDGYYVIARSVADRQVLDTRVSAGLASELHKIVAKQLPLGDRRWNLTSRAFCRAVERARGFT